MWCGWLKLTIVCLWEGCYLSVSSVCVTGPTTVGQKHRPRWSDDILAFKVVWFPSWELNHARPGDRQPLYYWTRFKTGQWSLLTSEHRYHKLRCRINAFILILKFIVIILSWGNMKLKIYKFYSFSLAPFYMNNYKQYLSVEAPPLKALLDATINAYIMTTHSRLASVSPRQYGDFVEFLARAYDVFSLLKPDGLRQFYQLVASLCHSYRGKRKLVTLLTERFYPPLF